jgi:hypothetical protein
LLLGKGEMRRTARTRKGRIALLAFGSMLTPALAVAEEFDASVANMRFVKPLDHALVLHLARTHEALVTLEENAVEGGAGSAVLEALAMAGLQPVLQTGLPPALSTMGSRIAAKVRTRCRRNQGHDAQAFRRAVSTRRQSPGQLIPRIPSLHKPIAIVQHEADVAPGNLEHLQARGRSYIIKRLFDGDAMPGSAQPMPGSVRSAAA